MQIPEDALIPLDDRQFVLLVEDDGVAKQVPVTIGRRRVGAVEVLDGLEIGQRVVVEGLMRVRPGQTVEVVGTRDSEP